MQRFEGAPDPQLVRSLVQEALEARRDASSADE